MKWLQEWAVALATVAVAFIVVGISERFPSIHHPKLVWRIVAYPLWAVFWVLFMCLEGLFIWKLFSGFGHLPRWVGLTICLTVLSGIWWIDWKAAKSRRKWLAPDVVRFRILLGRFLPSWIASNWPKLPPQIKQKLTPKCRSSVTPGETFYLPWDDGTRVRMMEQEPIMQRQPKYDGWWSAKDEREL